MFSSRGARPHDAPAASSSASSTSPSRRMACGRVLEWEAGLPSASELTPLSHPLVPPALAAAFRIDIARPVPLPSSVESPTSLLSFRFDVDADDDDEDDQVEEGEGETDGAAAAARGEGRRGGGKKARMVWTPELHHRFVEAVAHLGEKGAVPKAIVRLMNVDGLTRENVASHLQKYRLYLKRTRPPAAAAAGMPPPPPPPPVLCAPRFATKRPLEIPSLSEYCASASSPARSSDATTKQ